MPIVQDAAVGLSGVGQTAISRTGVLVYVPAAALSGLTGGGSDRTIVWVNRAGREEPIADVPPRAYFALRRSPDGTRLALDVRDQDSDVWIWEFARRTLTRLTFEPSADVFPVWTPDSRRIIFGSVRSGAFVNLYAQAADGTGSTERLGDAPYTQVPGSVLPDGSGVLLTQAKSGQNPDVALLPLSGKGAEAPVLSSAATERLPQISPDGRFVAFESDETTRSEVYVRPFPDVNGGKWQISNAGGTKPAWSPAGGELFYVDLNGGLMAVPVQLSPAFKQGNPVKLFEARNISTMVSGLFYDVAKDGKRFVMIKELPPKPGATQAAQGPTFIVVVNWIEELKAAIGK